MVNLQYVRPQKRLQLQSWYEKTMQESLSLECSIYHNATILPLKKSNKKLAIVIGVGALLFAVSYFLLGQPSAAMFNLISVVCSIVCLNDKLKCWLIFDVIAAMYIAATYFTADGWWSWVLMTAQIAGSYALMFKDGRFIRNLRFFYISPLWLINNTMVCFTLGGTLCEIITMISIIVSFIRYRKTGFEK